MKLKDLKKGDFFVIRDHKGGHVTDKQVYIKGEYDRSLKKYDCGRCDDISYSRMFCGDMIVYTDFTY